MNTNLLELQSDRIEAVLSRHQAAGHVTSGIVTPRWVRFQVLPAIGTKISRIKNLHEEIAAALNVSTCRVSRRGAAIAIEIPRDDPQPVRLLPLYNQVTAPNVTPAYPPITATLGLAEDGSPLLIRLPSPNVAHILVAGTTGSGKTVLLQVMILSLAMSNAPSDLSLVLIDPKGSAFSPFADLPHLTRPVVTQMEEITETLYSLVHLMERRTAPKPHVIVVMDEMADLLIVGERTIQHVLTRLTQRGREAAIHVIAATQKPVASVIGTLVKANFPVRLVGRVMCTEDARVATGWSGSGAERLMGQGDFLSVAEGRVIHFQAAHVSAAEIQETIAKMPATAPSSIPFNTPTSIRPVSPVLTLPPSRQPSSSAVTLQGLAHQLVQLNLWQARYDNHRNYRWGWMSQACRALLNHELEGTWDRQFRQVLSLAERISSTTTAQKPPGEGPRGGIVELRE